MSKSMQTKSNNWVVAWRAIATNSGWQFLSIAIGTLSSIIYPHVPLVAFAAVIGSTLKRQKALVAITSIWLVNQLYGYIIRQYPQTFESLIWGLTMGLAALLVTLLATLRPKLPQEGAIAHYIWLGSSLIIGFMIYQGFILFIGQFLGVHDLNFKLLWSIFIKDLVWGTALGLVHLVLVNRAIKLVVKP
jgi:hypothetical protein